MPAEWRAPAPLELDGVRLDVALSSIRPLTTRSQAARLIDLGHVLLDGAVGKASQRVRAGQVLVVVEPDIASVAAPGAPSLVILYEDDDMAVLDKPAGVVTHPAAGHRSGTVSDAVRAHWPHAPGDPMRPGIVHRLDRDTSGLLMVALSARGFAALTTQLAERALEKRYLALVLGCPDSQQGLIDAPIGRSGRDRREMAVAATGKEARTRFTVRETFPGYTLLDIELETGRTHQIRAHLSAIRHPVAGDAVYGAGQPADVPLRRQFLHAYRLRVARPADKRELVIESSLPPDLTVALDELRSRLR